MPPQTIAGRYEVVREIGRGGMGAVWLCRDQVLGREVAAKQLGGLPGESTPHLARALREARTSAALSHPNVVSIYDAVEEGHHVWLVMEYVPSRTLAQLTHEEGALPPDRVAHIGAQIADGLAAAHARGTVHRDVKPGNVLVGEDDQAKISDFGIARSVDDDTLTQTGMVTGTPMYFSPQLARGAAATPADDVWALGATLYSAVEGAAPWPAEQNSLALLVHIAEHPPPVPTSAGALTTLITRMMSADPAERPDMATAARELHAAARDEVVEEPTVAFATAEVPPPPPPDPTPTVERAPARDRPRSRRWPVAAVLALLVVAALGIAALVAQGDDDPAATGPGGSAPSDATGSTGSEPDAEETDAEETDGAATDPTGAAQFVTDYYALLPSDTKSAWDLLSEEMQDQVGSYGSYQGFWRTIDAVTVDDATADSSGTVTVDLTYTSDQGTESETRLITVEETEDGPRITGDQVA